MANAVELFEGTLGLAVGGVLFASLGTALASLVSVPLAADVRIWAGLYTIAAAVLLIDVWSRSPDRVGT